MIKRLLFSITIFLLSFGFVNAQYFLGMQSSEYGGITTIDFNPAIADSRYIVDINLIGLGASVGDNYIGLARQTVFNQKLFSDSNFQNDYLKERINGKPKSVYMGAQVQGPLSFMFSFGKKDNKNKNAIGVSYHVNSIFNLDGVNETFARDAYHGMGTTADSITHFIGQSLNAGGMSFSSMVWSDYGITYSRVIIDNDKHMLKIGGTLKILAGVAAGYFDVKQANYQWPNYDSVSLLSAKVKLNYSQGFPTSANYPISSIGSYAKNLYSFDFSHPSAALDLGAIYEWRPDKDNYNYKMDCMDNPRLDLNRYKLAAGISLIDFGAIRYKSGEYSGSFEANISDWDVTHNNYSGGLQSVEDTISSRFQRDQGQKTYFRMWLPTRINAFVDYNIYKGIGLNLTGNICPNMAPDHNMVHELTTIAFTPKYENAWFGFYMPVSYNVQGNVGWGATFRIGPLTVGSSDLLGFFIKKWIYNADVHAALKITIPYTKKHDRDKDGVSNKLDKCPKDKGPCISHGCPDRDGDGILDKDDRCPDQPGPAALKGCPDMDSDGVADIDDSCPTVPGPVALHGCPDRDSDGIPDYLDECPDQPGLAKFHGCPDRDSDGVPDKLDLCPDKPGSIEHHGCPDTDGDGVYDDEDRCVLTPGPKENQGCPWPDRDGDGIPDKDDKCPDVFGVPENFGCPKLEKKEIETVKYAFENLEFETGKDIIRTHSYASLNALANLLIEKKNYGLHIAGHTDNVGKAEMNQILSEKRANAVKAYLMKKGVEGSKLETVGYGDTKPIATNDTPEGRQKNRRVEMEITFR